MHEGLLPALELLKSNDQDGDHRPNGEVCEITDRLDLTSWLAGSRVIVRRERPHPGAQLSFIDHDGYRFQAILTEQPDPDIAIIERRHRQRAHVEDGIREDKDTGGLDGVAPLDLDVRRRLRADRRDEHPEQARIRR